MAFAVFNSDIDELGIIGLLCGSKDEGRVGRGILGLVFANS
jgi:hypothetical protein